jgi:aminopeptidase YwaD
VLESYGYVVEVQSFNFDSTRYLPARVDAGGEPLRALRLEGAPDGVVTGTLIDAGIGSPEDLPPNSATGAIALIERGTLQFSEKVANAAAAGAVGVIIFNNEDDNFVGNAPDATITAVSMRRDDGLALRDRLAAGQVTATITTFPPADTAINVVARPPGVTQCTTVTGGHADSVAVSPGADDNASGSGSVLEVARLAMARQLPGANCFVLFGAEEVGLWGSQHYVETLSEADIAAMRGMVNIDVVGLPQQLTLIGSEDLVEVARGHAQALGVEATPGTVPGGLGSDHANFAEVGIPVVFLYRHDPLFHTVEDAIDRIDANALEQAVNVAYATLEDIAGAP